MPGGKAESRGRGGKAGSSGAKGAVRRGGGKGSGAGPPAAPASEADPARGKAKDQISADIGLLLSGHSTLQRTDFDGSVRQCLHAIHGISGQQGVREALQIVNFFTSKKQRGVVRHWPAYVGKLVRKALDDIVAEERKKKLAGQALFGETGGGGTGVDPQTPLGRGSEGPLGGEAPGATPLHGKGQRARLDEEAACGSLKVPCRIRSGQLTEPDLHSEFICPICLDLCEDVALLPCSHVFCRECVSTFLDSKNAKQQVGCPTCRAPFTKEEAALDRPADSWLSRWIRGIKVCCAFCSPDDLPNPDDDPLPPGHRARQLGLSCGWTGTVSAYAEHIAPGGSCEVARELRRWQREEAAVEKSQYETPAKEPETPAKEPASQPAVYTGCAMQPADMKPSRGQPRLEGAAASPQTPPAAAIASCATTASAATPPSRPARDDAAASAPASAPASAGAGPDIGDFVVTSAWRFDDAFSVEAGDIVYVSELEPRGWVYAQELLSGRSGWMPRSHCQRHTWRAVGPFSPSLAASGSMALLALEPGDLVWVLDRQTSGWVYGEKRLFDWGSGDAAPRSGWFPSWAIGGS